MGTLRIHGTIDIKQFWPDGSSDADTTKIKLIVGDESFEYKEDNEDSFSKTYAFKDAISKGQGSKSVINTKQDGTQTITIRLQGVDAPELHYKAAPLKKNPPVSEAIRKKFNAINEERRQCFAESSTVALAKYLKQFSTDGVIEAIFETNVDKPFEVVDTYGRFIGNIYVGDDYEIDVNVWLVENGWGVPAFYTSMKIEEMQLFLNAWIKGKKKAGRTGKSISNDADNFDWELVYRRPSTNPAIAPDNGKVLMPKIFRRQNAWMVRKKAGVLSKSTKFQTYLKNNPDQLVLLDEFINQGIYSSTIRTLDEFVTKENLITKNPEEIIFMEKPGTLVDSKNKKITKW